jgi:hypothetical protein
MLSGDLAHIPAQASKPTATLETLKRAFDSPPDDARIMMRWWWFGPAVTNPELEREMRLMKSGGIGGFEVQPVYPLSLDGNVAYLSAPFLDALQFTGEKARDLGLRMDLTLGSGWPYGGPHILPENASGRLRVERTATPKLADGEMLIATIGSGNEAQSFIPSRTRQTVKRPAMGAEGFVLDHYNASALNVHLKTVGEPMLNALKATPPHAIFSDSLEVYNADWTPDFLRQFQIKRGYNLTPHLPELVGPASAGNAAVRHDWGKTLPLSTYRKIEEFARRGGAVIAVGRTPSVAPGLMEAETETPRIRDLTRVLFQAAGARGKIVRQDSELSVALRSVVQPDATLPREVGFVHRQLDFADVFFIVNTTNHPIRGTANFRMSGKSSQWWDPFIGKAANAGGERVALILAPYESRVLVFSKEPAPKGESVRAAGVPMDISSGWTITFPGSSPSALAQLHSWTTEADRKYFSGQAVYEKVVTLDRSLLTAGREVYLNFGEGTPITTEERRSGNGMRAMLDGPVREAAVVYMNGKLAGSVWHPPYEVDVTPLLQPGRNEVRVVVANLAINQLAKGPPRDYKDLTARFGERFQAQDMGNLQPLPSGLLGPIRLIPR